MRPAPAANPAARRHPAPGARCPAAGRALYGGSPGVRAPLHDRRAPRTPVGLDGPGRTPALQTYLKEHTNPPASSGRPSWCSGPGRGGRRPEQRVTVSTSMLKFIASNFEWLYIFGATGFVLFVF